ncbi:hypothetical protein [Bifidobacterium eulemuris]|uniref:ABC transporter, ATP-binding protein n=2 Tax=Bifidobacterium eulemuris TaxID=1765219 RepID=A0A261GBU3_9BIFI|nr:hypothetical protein [Bifidobacterium eulemuris]OZG68899.1 ABC transporter, ATP-binding protein [Bifidobacterium eulemuris]QOL31562.1 hypothetical protein BE0216_03110 [Bifidobacterium eulemuris]
MRLESILSEAMRNVSCGTARAVSMALAVLLVGGLFGGYEAMSVIALQDDAAARIRANADVATLVGAKVDGVTCDRLSSVPDGPSVSGAMRSGPQIVFAATPGRDVASYEVTPGLLHLLVADGMSSADAGGVWISRDMAGDFGLSVGSVVQTDQGTIRVGGVYDWDNDGRDTRFAYALVVPVSSWDGTFEECWAKQWPTSDDLDALLYSTAVVSGGESAKGGVTRLNKGFDSHYDASDSYRSRMTRWMPFVAGAVGLLIGWMTVRRRRLEYAGALHSGQSKEALVLTIAVETSVWAGLGTLASTSLLTALCARLASDDFARIAAIAVRTPIALCAAVIVSAVASGAWVRESQLFRFFKRR